MTQKAINDELRNRMAQIAIDAYTAAGFEVLQTAGGTWYIPCLDLNGDDAWFKLGAIVPKDASEENGSDGYTLAQDFQAKEEAAKERARKAAEKAEKAKAKKAAKAEE